MPIDPSIIGNVMAPAPVQLPDVNAMMQTRTAGMENIYKMEQVRAEQAKAAQAAQEAAVAEAMLPAVATAFSDPSDAGLDAATSLLPPEIAEAFAPFMQRLKALPDANQRKTMLRAELAKDKEGQFILGQLEPTANMALQAKTAERRADIDQKRYEIELAKLESAKNAPSGEYATVETEQGIFIINKKTGEIRPARPEGAPGSATDTGGPIDVEQPPQILQPKAKKSDAASESERIAGYNAGRALNAAKRIAAAVKEDPDATAPGAGEAFVNLFVDPNLIRSEERQRVSAAQREMIDALLTLATGAAYNREQLEGQMESYIPRWTDEKGTREDKRAALFDLIESAKVKAGRAWTPEMDAAFSSLLAEASGDEGAVDENNPLLSGKR